MSGGNCFMSLRQVNPLNLPLRPGVQETSLDNIRLENIALNNHMASKLSTNVVKNSSTGYNLNRIRREQNYIVGAETYVKNKGKQLEVKMVCHITYSFRKMFDCFHLCLYVLNSLGLFEGKCQMFQVSLSNK